MQQIAHPARRYDLDWLRVIAFGLLIFYHTGMLYVSDWGFHYKSQYQSEVLQYVMLLVNPWRMPLLFFISGIAVHYVLKNNSLFYSLRSRTWRLLLPLLFGILAVVPVQLYVEMKTAGVLDFGIGHFYQVFFNLDHPVFDQYQSGIWPHVDVNHLWYLRELWQFSLVLIILHPLLNAKPVKELINHIVASQHIGIIIGVWPVFLTCLVLFIFPEDDEGIRIARGFCFFVLGYLINENANWWAVLLDRRRLLLSIAFLSTLFFLSYYRFFWLQRETSVTPSYEYLETLYLYFHRWISLLAVCAYAAGYLNKEHAYLEFLSKAVYPSYIVHQSVLIAVCFYLTPFKLGVLVESAVVILTTFGSCLLTYLIAKKIGIFGNLLGVFNKSGESVNALALVTKGVFGVFVIVLGLKIIL